MELLLDCGNSRVKWAAQVRGRFVAGSAVAAGGRGFQPALDGAWGGLAGVRRVLAASVAAPAVEELLREVVADRFGLEVEFLASPVAALGVRNGYADPARLGIDRFLGLVAARARIDDALVLASAGTAFTLDALAADGRHLGGLIIPGAALMRRSLARGTAKLREAPGEFVEFPDTTADAVWSGTLQALAGAANRFVRLAARRFGARPRLVLTGGAAPALSPLLADAERMDDLVLDGLALWARPRRTRRPGAL
ncbi:MAG: type III pantothenate kinase [Lysobacterales bacterium]